jgi:hypothetical protein
MRCCFLCLALMPVVAGCAANGEDGPKPSPTASPSPALGPEFDVYEAIFRQHIGHVKDDPKKGKPIFYLAIGGGDPPPKFIERFADRAGQVLPQSKHQPKAPDANGFMLLVASIEWKGADKARVMGNAYPLAVSLRCGTPYPTIVSRKDGKWFVTDK